MIALVAAFVSGLLFAVGLCVSGMTQPAKVLGFLDVTGAWDPSLAFVMIGAIAVHLPFARRALREGARPRLAPRFELPKPSRVDAKLLAGAALFGLGWGSLGYCPGPAVVSIATMTPAVIAFVASMLAGMWLAQRLVKRPA